MLCDVGLVWDWRGILWDVGWDVWVIVRCGVAWDVECCAMWDGVCGLLCGMGWSGTWVIVGYGTRDFPRLGCTMWDVQWGVPGVGYYAMLGDVA